MSLTDWLEADVGVVGARLRQGFNWWVGELAALVGPLTRQGPRGAGGVIAQPLQDGAYQLWRGGQPVGRHEPGQGRMRAALAMPADLVLVRELLRPAVADSDLRRITVLDLDRLTPFRPERLFHHIAVAPSQDSGQHKRVRLTVALKTPVLSLLAQARDAGIEPTALLTSTDVSAVDFLPLARGRSQGGRARLIGWSVVALLMVLNVCAAVWRDVRATEVLQQRVADQEPVVARLQQSRRRLGALQAQAAAHLAARQKGEPLGILNAISKALPSGVWVQRYSFDGATARLVGERRGNVEVLPALRAVAGLQNVHPADATAPLSTGFDIVAEVKPQFGSGAR